MISFLRCPSFHVTVVPVDSWSLVSNTKDNNAFVCSHFNIDFFFHYFSLNTLDMSTYSMYGMCFTFYGENQITLHCGNRTATLCMLYSPCVQICNLINYTLILLLILPFSDMCSALWKRQQREFKCSFSPAFLLISDRDGDWSLSFDLASVNEIFFSFTSFKVLRLMRVWSVNFSYKDEM